MSALDDKIAETLNNGDRHILESCGRELGFFGLIGESFRGTFSGIVIAMFLFILAFAVILVFSAIQFFTIEVIEMKLNWMAIALTALLVIGFLRLCYFIELARLSVVRQVKRLELQIALLSKRQL